MTACWYPDTHAFSAKKILERETGIEPATNSLEGCDSTTELLPPFVPLSYIHRGPSLGSGFRRAAQTPRRRLNLEGCDSTTELLPPSKTAVSIQPSAFSPALGDSNQSL